GPERGVELDAEPSVDVHGAGVVFPGHSEHQLALGFTEAFDDLAVGKLRVLGQDRPEGDEHLSYRLVEFRFGGIPTPNVVVDALEFLIEHHRSSFVAIDRPCRVAFRSHARSSEFGRPVDPERSQMYATEATATPPRA